MATLVLTAVGSFLGGPIGGAIGSLVGQQIDSSWLAPHATREGPRLKELEVQTSSYGTAIPAIFGAMRVAGTVIWATDLIESSKKQSGGKGRASTVEYSYSVSLAVALSSRPVARIGRIWADGNLLRGAEGDLKVETALRLHSGHADQSPDPLMASAEAAGECPAHRGFAYAVLEDLQLATFGNRIPQLTFEVFERETPVRLLDIAGDVARIAGDCSAEIGGYALSGNSGRAALSPLLTALPVLLRADGDQLELIDWPNDEGALAVLPLAKEGPRSLPPPQNMLASAKDVPATMKLPYYDPARDYQASLQHCQRSGAAESEKQIDLPASLSADAALAFAESQLLQAHRARVRWEGHIPISSQRLRPGDWLQVPFGGKYRVETIEHGRANMRIDASGAPTNLPQLAIGSSGRVAGAIDQPIGETRLVLADLPASGSDADKPIIAAFAAGTHPGWRRAALSVRIGSDLVDNGRTAAPAVMGEAETVLGAHAPFLIDSGNSVVVQLLHDGMALPAATGSPLDNSAPLCLLGSEFLRYGNAEALGSNRYRLSQLLRGLYGSEEEIGRQAASESFVLIEPAAAKIIDESSVVLGQILQAEAMGLADQSPVAAEIQVIGRAVTPLPPVHANAGLLADGAVRIQWQWRSRIDFGWQVGVDQPCLEMKPLFAIRLLYAHTLIAQWEVEANYLLIPSGVMDSLGLPAEAEIEVEICQIGSFARSAPSVFTFLYRS